MSIQKKYTINQLRAGAILSYAQMALGIIINLIYTPVMLRILGRNEYGLYNTVASAISSLSILSLGFNSGYIRYYAIYKKENDFQKIFRLNGMFFLIFCIIGVVALVCGGYLAFHLELVFANGLTPAELSKARTLMLMLTVNLAFSFPMSVFGNIISAHEKFFLQKAVGLLKTVISPLLTLPLLLMGYGSVGVVAITIAVALVADGIHVYYVVFRLKNRFWFDQLDRRLFAGLFAYTSFIVLNMIIDQINWNIDKVLLGRFCGTAMVAVYVVGYTFYDFYMRISTAISGVLTPRVHQMVNEHVDKAQLSALFVKVGRIQFLIQAMVVSGFALFGKPFIRLWVGEGYEDSYWVAVLLMLAATIPLIQNLGIEIQRALNKHQFRSIAYSVMAIVNLLISIYLCQRYGAIGSAVGTCISLLAANGAVMNWYYYKECGIDIPLFWKSVFCISKGLIVPIASGIVITRVWEAGNWGALLVQCVLYAGIYGISMWLFGMNEYEKKVIVSFKERLG